MKRPKLKNIKFTKNLIDILPNAKFTPKAVRSINYFINDLIYNIVKGANIRAEYNNRDTLLKRDIEIMDELFYGDTNPVRNKVYK